MGLRGRAQLIERMGLAAEADGLPRIAGRLFGALLLSDEPRSLDELAEALGVSKGSVSTDARRLLERGVVERVARPGDRRDYYQLAPDFFGQIIRHRDARWEAFSTIVAEMAAAAPAPSAELRARFAYVQAVHDFIVARVEDALRAWADRGPTRRRGRARFPRRARTRRGQPVAGAGLRQP